MSDQPRFTITPARRDGWRALRRSGSAFNGAKPAATKLHARLSNRQDLIFRHCRKAVATEGEDPYFAVRQEKKNRKTDGVRTNSRTLSRPSHHVLL